MLWVSRGIPAFFPRLRRRLAHSEGNHLIHTQWPPGTRKPKCLRTTSQNCHGASPHPQHSRRTFHNTAGTKPNPLHAHLNLTYLRSIPCIGTYMQNSSIRVYNLPNMTPNIQLILNANFNGVQTTRFIA